MAEQAALQARAKLEELEKQLDKNVVDVADELKNSLMNKISLFHDHLNSAKSEVFKAKELAGLSENYWKKVSSFKIILFISIWINIQSPIFKFQKIQKKLKTEEIREIFSSTFKKIEEKRPSIKFPGP